MLSKYQNLSVRANREFSNIADYFWKSPRLIKHETELERQKLNDYFPNDEKYVKLRWNFEGNKLNKVFPYLIAVGNTFSAMSLFESYLLLVAIDIEKDTGVEIKSISGNGINRMIKYFRKVGIKVEDIVPFHQISAAIKIRNCLSHASGMLAWSKDANELKKIKKFGLYLTKKHRSIRIKNGTEYYEIQIISSGLGDRLQVDNMYPFVLVSYLRDYLIGLCQSADILVDNEAST